MYQYEPKYQSKYDNQGRQYQKKQNGIINGPNGGQKQTLNHEYEKKKICRDAFHDGEQLQTIFCGVYFYQEVDIVKELETINLIQAIEYIPIQTKLLENILNFLKKFSQSRSSEIKKFVQIILQSDLFKNLLYQVCLTIYDQPELVDQKKIVDLFKDLHSIFQLCSSIADLRFSPIIYPIELTELVDSDYPKSELATMFDKYGQLKDSLKNIQLSNDYLQCPVEPIMLELDFKQQIIGNLEKTNYLNYHYFILREDYLREFKQFIYKFKTKNTSKSDTQFPLYQEAQLIDFELSNKDLIWTIKMKQYDMDGRRRQVWDWKKSKRLTNGALLAFTNVEGYPIVFGVILKRDTYQPSYRSKFEIKLSIKLLSRDIQQFLDLFKCTNIVIENPIIYEASISYLLSLKTLKLPFSDVIVNGSKKVNYPKYILNFTYQIYLQTTNDHTISHKSRHNQSAVNKSLQDSQWQSQGTLDQSQIDALKLMLSAEIALIQGPPGTGKTFCGALAVRNLLANVKLQQLPILVVCYTNHALDQFLSHIIKYVDHQDVLRLGFGCKDPNIIPFMMTPQKTKIKFEWDQFKSLKKSIESLLHKILGKRCHVTKGDIQNHWPELYDEILRNDYVHHIKDKNIIFECWIQGQKPPNVSSSIQFYGDKSYLSQVKQIYRYQPLSELNEDEFIDDIEVEVNEYFDSDEESLVNYFQDDYSSQSDEYSQKDSGLNYMETFVNKRIPYDYKGIFELQNKKFNPWLLNKSDIKGILDYIAHLKLLQDIQEYSSLFQSFEVMSAKLKLLYQDANYEYFNKKKIIGVTITGAAKYTETLKKLDTKILIIEEAAEVLESHLISILTPNIQHLILIGDHQQLKPKLSCYELEQQYKANTSLFQKLFEQGISNVTLTCQRRMKSKFADFIRLIYGNTYKDNIPYQQENQRIDGINSDLIYFNHSWLEERDANSTSTQNKKEANMIIELVIYLIGCRHEQETITVLTLYLQQAVYIKKVLDSKNLKNVKVQTVDNYQGEENEIVILSLVRSNNQGSIGFVKLDNRINVALSRARVALYVFGNFKCIRQNSSPQHLWSRILALAEQKQVLKDHLELCCLRHRNVRLARTPEEIRKLSPGCCNTICNAPYPSCNHRCLKTCHFGDHLAAECAQNCERKLNCGHQCQAKCNQQCSLYQCYENVKKVLPCQHQVIVVCSKYQQNVICQESITQRFPCGHSIICKCLEKDKYGRCLAKCEKKLLCGHPNIYQCDECYVRVVMTLSCGHIQEYFCYEVTNQSYLYFKCTQPCRKQNECGHPSNCKLLCHQPCSPCNFIIPKTLSCGHQYPFKCSQLKNGITPFAVCQNNCIKKRVCGHNDPCRNICSEVCSPCQVACQKKRDCGHSQPCTKLCSHNSTCSPCQNDCTRQRTCGHEYKCSNRCYQECTQCEQPVDRELPCGHTLIMKCFKSDIPQCNQTCKRNLRCGHKCQHACHKPCPPCSTNVLKQLTCGHQVQVSCCQINQPYLGTCMKECKKILTCGHPNQCRQLCSQPCDPCKIMMQKTKLCGHEIEIMCSELNQLQSIKCEHPVNKLLLCGHTLRMMCSQLAKPVICQENCIKFKNCGHIYEQPCLHPCHLPCPPCTAMTPKQLECGHQVDVQCFEINEPYLRACMNACKKQLACEHPSQCTQLCSQPCDPCRVMVQKVLPCGHNLQVMCFEFGNPVNCEQNCIRIRMCGHNCTHPCFQPCPPCGTMVPKRIQCGHQVDVQCFEINKPYQRACIKSCLKQLTCRHPNQCTQLCSQPCDPCQVIVQKVLPCGHSLQVVCYKLGIPVICEENCIKVRNCGHPCSHPCYKPCPSCYTMVPKKLQCGHEVDVLCCRSTSPYGRNCRNPCQKSLICGHPNQCTQLCSQPCDPCRMMVEKSLPCGHSLQVMCFKFDDLVICQQNCLKIRTCGHTCSNPCYMTCSSCYAMVPKRLQCGHDVDVPCCESNKPYQRNCMKSCLKQLNCGHQSKCTQPCSQPCDPCRAITQKFLPCGHTLKVMCFELGNSVICQQNCVKIRRCGHPCSHPCHKPCLPCAVKVSQQRECGHIVDENCSLIYYELLGDCMQTPCLKTLTCGHQNMCKQPCSKDCDPCQEKVQKFLPCGHFNEVQCSRKPEDAKCSKPCQVEWCFACNSPFLCENLCGEPCSPCQQRVVRQLDCGHEKSTICGDQRNFCLVIVQKQKDCGQHFENVVCKRRDEPIGRCKEHNCCIIF